jgi:hypothetical protein
MDERQKARRALIGIGLIGAGLSGLALREEPPPEPPRDPPAAQAPLSLAGESPDDKFGDEPGDLPDFGSPSYW